MDHECESYTIVISVVVAAITVQTNDLSPLQQYLLHLSLLFPQQPGNDFDGLSADRRITRRIYLSSCSLCHSRSSLSLAKRNPVWFRLLSSNWLAGSPRFSFSTSISSNQSAAY